VRDHQLLLTQVIIWYCESLTDYQNAQGLNGTLTPTQIGVAPNVLVQ
jgi:hypothetical protein